MTTDGCVWRLTKVMGTGLDQGLQPEQPLTGIEQRESETTQ